MNYSKLIKNLKKELIKYPINRNENKTNFAMNKLQILMPVYNEAQSIEDTIKEKSESQKLQDQLEPITENKDRFPTAEERWPRAGETIKEVKQVEIKPVNYFNVNKRPEPKVEETDVNSLAQAMSNLIKKPEQLNEQPQLSDLEKLQLEFKQFRKLVTMQMASIGGGCEVRLLNLDDVDTSSLGNGKFLVYNATSKKLEFTDQVDGN